MKKKIYFLLAIPLFLLGCAKDYSPPSAISSEGFVPITEADFFSTIAPFQTFDYYEFRTKIYGPNITYETLYANGTECANASDTALCFATMDTLIPTTGIDFDWLLVNYNYVIAQKADDITLYTTRNELISFLGSIDTKSDALLLTQAKGYSYHFNNVQNGGIKIENNTIYVIALKIVDWCDPIETDRVLLKIDPDGTITTLQQEFESTSDGCI